MRRFGLPLVLASVSGILITLITSAFRSGFYVIIGGHFWSYYGWPFPFYEVSVQDLLGTFHYYFILNAIGDFLIYFGVSFALLTVVKTKPVRSRIFLVRRSFTGRRTTAQPPRTLTAPRSATPLGAGHGSLQRIILRHSPWMRRASFRASSASSGSLNISPGVFPDASTP